MFHVKHFYIFTVCAKICYTLIKSKKEVIMFKDKEGTTLATEIFKELKASARRWFIAFCIMCGIEFATVGGFLWYISLPVDEVVDIQNDDGNANYIGGDVGGDINNGQDNSAETAGQETPEEITE